MGKGLREDDRDDHNRGKINRSMVKRAGSDEVERYREGNVRTGRERGKGKCADRYKGEFFGENDWEG